MLRKIIFFIALLIFALRTSAADLITLYHSALNNNQHYASQMMKNELSKKKGKEARAVFLPQLSLGGNSGYQTSRTQFDIVSQYFPALPLVTHSQGEVYNVNLKLEQIIFDMTSWKQMRASKKFSMAEKLMQQEYRAQLMNKIIQDYFSVLSVEDQLKYLRAEKLFYQHQLRVARNKKEIERATQLDIDEALSSLTLTKTAEVASKNK